MDNVIYKIKNETYQKNIIITSGDAIFFTVELDTEAISMLYACAGNLHGDNFEFKKEIGNGIVPLGDNKYAIKVNSADTVSMSQGIYNHNLRVETSVGIYTIMDGLIIVESDTGAINPQGVEPIFINYNSYIDGTIKDVIISNAEIIPDYMFYGCNQLINVYLLKNITSIGQYAFHDCTNLSLTLLPDSITSIGQYAFDRCTNLLSLTFLGKPDFIAINAFRGCTNLTDIYVPWQQGEVANAPWGATNATIHYNS